MNHKYEIMISNISVFQQTSVFYFIESSSILNEFIYYNLERIHMLI